jgi:ribosomal protein S18 acetylase RimI-like enzyme
MNASKTPEPDGPDDLSPATFIVNDLRLADLPRLKWAGDQAHMQAIRKELARVPSGDVEYLALRGRGGQPLAKGAIDYSKNPEAGTLWQLATKPELRGHGLGTRLIASMEQRILQHGRHVAKLGVEDDNPRARQLYKQLGYQAYRHEPQSWQQTAPNGQFYTHHTQVTLMRKKLD